MNIVITDDDGKVFATLTLKDTKMSKVLMLANEQVDNLMDAVVEGVHSYQQRLLRKYVVLWDDGMPVLRRS